MTSKNSFLASLMENNKRRIWLWLVSVLGFVILWPSAVAMTISRALRMSANYMEAYGAQMGEQLLKEQLISGIRYILGISDNFLYVGIAIFAIISGIQGFSYLYSRKKIDFYMGMPVKRKRRFFIIWLNGILAFLIPYLIGKGIGILFALVNGGMNGAILSETMMASALSLFFYLGIYHLAILAVMMTGNVIITGFGVLVFLLYEGMIRIIIQSYMDLFFKHFSYYGFQASPMLSPFTMLQEFAQKFENGQGNFGLTMLNLLLFAIGIGIIAYLCYLKRPAEAAGRAMAFRFPQPIIKILLTIPMTLLAGIIISDMSNYDPVFGDQGIGFIIFSMALTLLICNCLIQVIYEFDIKGIMHKNIHILISGAAVIFIFLIFRFDIFGYDTHIPAVEKIESAAFIPSQDYYYGGNTYVDEQMNYLSAEEYASEYMYLSDVGAVSKLAKKAMVEANSIEQFDVYRGDLEGTWYSAMVIFRLGNGKEVCRNIYVNVEDAENVELLNRIEDSDEFRLGYYLGAGDILDQALKDSKKEISVLYGNSVYQQKLGIEDLKELLTLYKKDIQTAGFSNVRENMANGYLLINTTTRHQSYSSIRESFIEIYPFFTECINYLKERGYYMENQIRPEDVERIQITNYNRKLQEAKEKELQESEAAFSTDAETNLYLGAQAQRAGYYGSDFDMRTFATYDDQAEIEKLAEYIYPENFSYANWSREKGADTEYSVTVYFKPDSNVAKDYGNTAYYSFIEGEVPEFVVKDTLYTEK